jgi:predicted Fe-Mo cluster-binding NifX family protein
MNKIENEIKDNEGIKMKIAVASTGKDAESQVSAKGGRAPYYLIFEDDKLVKTIKNPFAVGGGGAGVSVAYMLAKEKVKLVLVGELGGNMKMVLEEKGVKSKSISGMTVKDALADVLESG